MTERSHESSNIISFCDEFPHNSGAEISGRARDHDLFGVPKESLFGWYFSSIEVKLSRLDKHSLFRARDRQRQFFRHRRRTSVSNAVVESWDQVLETLVRYEPAS